MHPNYGADQSDRLILQRLSAESASSTFAHDVLTGLNSHPKALPPKYFYDELGSHLFEAICCLPEYYVTRDEAEILETYSEEIIEAVNLPTEADVRLIELGSGSAEKTRHLIDPLLTRSAELHYVPIDISETSLVRSSQELLQLYPRLRITAYAGDYSTALDALSRTAPSNQQTRTIVIFLGSSIGNLTREESVALLKRIRRLIKPHDVMLLGADLKKSLNVLLPAYDDALKVTAAFNLNLLVRINRELRGEFDIGRFEHRALYNEEHSRIEMHLFSRVGHTVKIQALDLEAAFAAGESIHTENSYKFDTGLLADLAAKTGFLLESTWYDSHQRFSFNLLAAQSTDNEPTSSRDTERNSPET